MNMGQVWEHWSREDVLGHRVQPLLSQEMSCNPFHKFFGKSVRHRADFTLPVIELFPNFALLRIREVSYLAISQCDRFLTFLDYSY